MAIINKTVTGNAFNFAADAASSFITTTGDLTLESTAGSILVRGGEAVSNAVQIAAFNAAGGIDIDAGVTSGIINIDAGGAISIDAGAASNFSTSVGDLTLATAGVVDLTAQLKIQGGSPGLDKILRSDAVGLATWIAPESGTTYEASDFLNSTATGWSVTALAPSIVDPTLNMVNVRAFDGAIDEAVGIHYFIPGSVTSLDISLIWRKSSSVAGTVIWQFHARQFISGSVITADSWDTSETISTSDPGSNQNIVKSTATLTLANLSITADQLAYFQIVRDASADGYNADAYVLSLNIRTS